MAIQGPLRELALPDIIQLLHLSRKTGVLSVVAETGGRSGTILFDEGGIVGARPAGESSPLGHLLVLAGEATVGQVEAALRIQRLQPGRRIGELLVETQGVARPQVERQLRFQIEEAIFDLVRWEDGHFRFEEAAPPEAGEIGIRIRTDSLLMEAMRRADEWTELASGDPDATLVPALVDTPADPQAILMLEPREWQVLAAVDGARSLGEIARELGQAEFEVAKAVYGLASAGVVELRTRSAGARPPSPLSPDLPTALRAVKGALAGDRLDEARTTVEALWSRHRDSAEVAMLRARVLARAGAEQEALAMFQEAVRLDASLAGAYYHMGLTAVRVGDFAHARESLQRFMQLPAIDPEQVQTASRVAGLVAELGGILEEER